MGRRDPSVFPFLELPYEIRDDIYRLVLEYPNLNGAFDCCKDVIINVEEKADERLRPSCTLPRPRTPAMRTPAILLLNRQITAQALPILRNTTFVLDRCPPYSTALGREMDITDFIGEETLRKIVYVELRLDLDGRPKLGRRTIETLLDVWAAGHSLRKLTVWAYERPWDSADAPRISFLRPHARRGNMATSKIRNFVEADGVTLEGDLGNLPEARLIRGRR